MSLKHKQGQCREYFFTQDRTSRFMHWSAKHGMIRECGAEFYIRGTLKKYDVLRFGDRKNKLTIKQNGDDDDDALRRHA